MKPLNTMHPTLAAHSNAMQQSAVARKVRPRLAIRPRQQPLNARASSSRGFPLLSERLSGTRVLKASGLHALAACSTRADDSLLAMCAACPLRPSPIA